ncbi:hypothetical protein ACFO1B_41655 [Dactylosporangium siamense]|uniref:hypothetical protein n=1 Tax=Dactylosporangium siamense TaxID=685454 RepID=UPI001EF270ED|nr:hypothetical protein [Dactylosporangium siamense]
MQVLQPQPQGAAAPAGGFGVQSQQQRVQDRVVAGGAGDQIDLSQLGRCERPPGGGEPSGFADPVGRTVRGLSGFGWWFASGQFPAGWALEQLRALLRSGGAVSSAGSQVAERLANLCSENLAEVVAVTAQLIDAPNEPWFLTGSRQELTDVLSAGVASTDAHTGMLATDTVNRLVARGFGTFENLLKPSLRLTPHPMTTPLAVT